MSACPFANQSHRYDSRYSGRYTGGPNKGVLHTTEGGSLPRYLDGGNAPHFTVRANVKTKTVTVYQHFDTNRPARALVNKSGGTQTNNDGCIQIELIGSCDRATAETYGLIYWPEAPTWALDGLKKLMRWIEKDRGIPRKATTRPWLNYGKDSRAPGRIPASYGNSPARMGQSEFDNFAGWCGHQHVAENSHGDPGNIDIGYLLSVTPPKRTVVTLVGVTLAALATIFGLTTGQLEAANPGIAPSLRPSVTVTLPSGVNQTPGGATGVTKPGGAVPPAAQAPAKPPATTARTLYKGTSGADVKTLQTRLGIPADGKFGAKTDRAVRDFQYVKGLTVDGKAGPATMKALGSRWSKPSVRSGDRGRYVVVVQRLVGVTADGKFGPKTKAAVQAFEKRHGLLANGIWSDSTWARAYR